MPILIFLQMAPGVDMKSCNACQNRYLVSERMPKNVEIKIWSGNACQMMNFDSISQVNPYSNSQSINVAFSPGVISLYAASVGSHTFGRPGGGQKCGPRRRPPMCILFLWSEFRHQKILQNDFFGAKKLEMCISTAK